MENKNLLQAKKKNKPFFSLQKQLYTTIFVEIQLNEAHKNGKFKDPNFLTNNLP